MHSIGRWAGGKHCHCTPPAGGKHRCLEFPVVPSGRRERPPAPPAGGQEGSEGRWTSWPEIDPPVAQLSK